MISEPSISYYRRPGGTASVAVVVEAHTVWLTQAGLAELFGVGERVIARQLQNLSRAGELADAPTVPLTESGGSGGLQHSAQGYDLDATLAVGYRVNAREATRFRRWAMDCLAEARRGLATFYEQGPASCQRLDAQGRLLDVNARWLARLGYERGEVIGRPFSDFLTPASRTALATAFPRFLETGLIDAWEGELQGKAGVPLKVAVDGAFVRDAAGRPQHACCVLHELTRQPADQTLQMFQFSIDQASDGVFWMDREARFTYVNEQACDQLGYSREELVGLHLWDVDPIFPKELWRSQWEGYQSRRIGGSERLESIHQRKDGTRFPVEVVSRHLWFGEQELHVAVACDITERKRAEAHLARQAALLDAANDAIFVRTLDHTVTYWNRAAEKLFGWTRAEMLGRKLTELDGNMGEVFAVADATLLKTGSWSGELKRRNQAEQERTLFCRWTLLRDEQGRAKEVLAINTDVTKQKQLEASFLRAQRLDSIGALAGGIAHDLNNILQPILLTVPLLSETTTSPEAREMLGTMGSCAQRGADIIRQLLTFARGSPGTRRPLPLGHLLHDTQKIIRETFPRNLRTTVGTPADLWLVLGDPTQIHQAIMNLCVNARDAMPGGGTLTLTALNWQVDKTMAAASPGAQPGGHVRIRVTDTGCGMPPAILDRIFDPFFTTKEIGRGTGLGLASVLGIMRGHGGFVQVKSTVGEGTTFDLYFPALPEAAASPPAPPTQLPPKAAGDLILVVDDEPSVRLVVQRALERQGYQVVVAADGAEAIALLDRYLQEIRAIITDMMMPGMDGRTLARAVRGRHPHLPIIGMTGLADGVDGLAQPVPELTVLLTKPFNNVLLLDTLHHLLPAPTATT